MIRFVAAVFLSLSLLSFASAQEAEARPFRRAGYATVPGWWEFRPDPDAASGTGKCACGGWVATCRTRREAYLGAKRAAQRATGVQFSWLPGDVFRGR